MLRILIFVFPASVSLYVKKKIALISITDL